MFRFPMNNASTATTNNVASQLDLKSLPERFMRASLKLQELNRQALTRMVEETATDIQKAMKVRTLADAQVFLGEQSKASVEKVTGYWQNFGNIALETWGSSHRVVGAVETTGKGSDASVPITEEFVEKPAVIAKPHEAEVHPSPLVEKLVASVAVPPEISGTSSGARSKH